ncbi:MAG: phosphoglycerate transporter [Chloroflexi bacterium RBG_13_54_8]|nr:MAG: phosphoglycerate transporter [Chloroflexi bacterium RBG_13_54_8]
MYSLGWFSTGRGPGSRNLLTVMQDSIQRGEIKADIRFVFCSRDPGEAEGSDLFIELVRSYHLPLVCFSSRKFQSQKRKESASRWRLEYDREVMRRLEGFHPDLCVLAGYMLIVGPEMCQRYQMINLHPAVPGGPTGTWQEVIWKLMESQAESTGAMMHLVTPALDKGPPITFCTFPIRGERFERYWREIQGISVEEVKRQQGEDSPLFQLIRQQGVVRELPLVTSTVKAFSEGRVRVDQGQVVDARGKPIAAYDLTAEIDQIVHRKAAG